MPRTITAIRKYRQGITVDELESYIIVFDNGETLITNADDILSFDTLQAYVERSVRTGLECPDDQDWQEHVRSIYEQTKLADEAKTPAPTPT